MFLVCSKSFTGMRKKHLVRPSSCLGTLWRCLHRFCRQCLQRYIECFEVAASTKRQVRTQLEFRSCIDVTSASFNTFTGSTAACSLCSACRMQRGQCSYVAVSHAGEAVNNSSFIQHVECAVCLIC